ncbi:MAG: hypothetical protein B7Z66_06900 [Chromatiales bacterium 21-64-14]|nr:MAG: hypothetical protein B7Z66_06900 [Chromatiales bacterium 21-64-14]HQU16828.1 hypothetical protein [Gammaproteobacteria bacterium]
MTARGSNKDQQMRQRIAVEAARIMAEQGVRDFLAAKRKAAERLGAPDTRHLPRNLEIERELATYQRLFQSTTQPQRLRELRQTAREAMEFFSRFNSRLVGSVLNGTAGEHSDVNLHLFADTPEDVVLFMLQENIPFERCEHRLRIARDNTATFPAFRFVAGDTVIDLTVFPVNGIRQAPCSPVDGKPMRRADLDTVARMLEE